MTAYSTKKNNIGVISQKVGVCLVQNTNMAGPTGPVMEKGGWNQALPLSQGDLLHFCPFDPTGAGVAVQNKHSPADSKY